MTFLSYRRNCFFASWILLMKLEQALLFLLRRSTLPPTSHVSASRFRSEVQNTKLMPPGQKHRGASTTLGLEFACYKARDKRARCCENDEAGFKGSDLLGCALSTSVSSNIKLRRV